MEHLLLSESATATQRSFRIGFQTHTAPSAKVILRCVKNFQTTGNISLRKSIGRPPTVRTEQNVPAVEDNVKMLPTVSVGRTAHQ